MVHVFTLETHLWNDSKRLAVRDAALCAHVGRFCQLDVGFIHRYMQAVAADASQVSLHL